MDDSRNFRVVMAPDAFKGGADALSVAHAMARGLAGLPGVVTEIFPMADGGEGTARILAHGQHATRHTATTVDAFSRPHKAHWLQVGSTAIIEAAQGSGYVPPEDRPSDGTYTTSLGTGLLIAAAMDDVHVTQVLVCLGGTGSSDGGLGLWVGMGGTARDSSDAPIDPLACHLAAVEHLSAPVLRKPMIALYDVAVPLMGPQGCLRMFGPQKGVPVDQIPIMESDLAHWASKVQAVTVTDVLDVPGAGAAGGMGFILAALGATLKRGAEYVAQSTGLVEALTGADLCLTGEGSIDAQSLQGKVVATVTRIACNHSVPVVAVAGQIQLSPENEREFSRQGLTAIVGILDSPYPVARALLDTTTLVEAAVHRALGMGLIALIKKEVGTTVLEESLGDRGV